MNGVVNFEQILTSDIGDGFEIKYTHYRKYNANNEAPRAITVLVHGYGDAAAYYSVNNMSKSNKQARYFF